MTDRFHPTGKIEWARGYGVADASDKRPVSTDTLFQVASISKSVSAAAILRLVQQGKLGLDDDVNSRLLSWKLQGAPGAPAPVVTVRQLLSHTGGTTVSGFAGYTPTEPVPGLQAILNGEKPANSPRIFVDTPPGQALRYSGGGYTVLQQMVMDVTDQPFDKLMQASVFDPLNMRHSTFAQPLPPRLQANAANAHDKSGAVLPGKWNTYPTLAAAGLWSTPSDLALRDSNRASQRRQVSHLPVQANGQRHADACPEPIWPGHVPRRARRRRALFPQRCQCRHPFNDGRICLQRVRAQSS